MSKEEVSELKYQAPETKYFKSKEEFNEAVAKDFIEYANRSLKKGEKFLIGMSHGKSPSGAYKYVVKHFDKIIHPHNLYFTFVNSPLKSQESVELETMDARSFIKTLLKLGLIKIEQVLGKRFVEAEIEQYMPDFNQTIQKFLDENNKEGLDYAMITSNPKGRIAGIERKSKAFESNEITTIVTIDKEKELTCTPSFLLKTKRIAFLATKADKRRPLAWLYSTDGQANESPSFIRFIDTNKQKITVFVDDKALTWPQIEIYRETPYGVTTIRLDTTYPYKENTKEKLPVLIMVHGFLGLNSFDGLLTKLPTTKYIAAAMHYGTIPDDLPVKEYSNHVMLNIDAVIQYFGSKGHPVYLFDHSMGNTYFLMMDREYDNLVGVKKYLKGRIGANPFFGEEVKHAILGFMDYVIIPSMKFVNAPIETSFLAMFRRVVPLDSKFGVRKRAMNLASMVIGKEHTENSAIWSAIKARLLYQMGNLDSVPELNRIPIEKAMNRIPPKIFAIQSSSALRESKKFDKQVGLTNTLKHHLPVMILKSELDGVAKYVPRLYESENVKVVDVTNGSEHDFFREHLYHMVEPIHTSQLISEFIDEIEANNKKT